jgi:hypothetical protein
MRTSATAPSLRPGRLEAACLVLFPLLFLVFAGTGLHPDPWAETTADQVRAVAREAGAWQVVHLVLAAGSLLGMGAILALRRLIPDDPRRRARAASVAAALGMAAAGLAAGFIAVEAVLVAPVAKACTASGSCLAPGNERFLVELASRSWNDLAHLSYALGTLLFSLAALAVLGWRAGSLRPWEALAVVVGVVGIYATNTVLHGEARYGLTFLAVAAVSIALRTERSGHHG